MSHLSTELMNALLKNDSIDEFFRQHLENALNDISIDDYFVFLGCSSDSKDKYIREIKIC